MVNALLRNGMKDAVKKHGAGKANWGNLQDDIDEARFPINEPFDDADLSTQVYSELQTEHVSVRSTGYYKKCLSHLITLCR
jgi:hypothetical protein